MSRPSLDRKGIASRRPVSPQLADRSLYRRNAVYISITSTKRSTMKIAVLGSGFAGRTLAAGLADLGHHVTIGTRDVTATRQKNEPDRMGNAGYAVWAQDFPHIGLARFADAAAGADLFVNATAGNGSIAALTAAGAANLGGRVLLDVSNPLEFSQGFPPNLRTHRGGSFRVPRRRELGWVRRRRWLLPDSLCYSGVCDISLIHRASLCHVTTRSRPSSMNCLTAAIAMGASGQTHCAIPHTGPCRPQTL
jgi:hypothetical protein